MIASKLTLKPRVAFCAAICQRMLPLYVMFYSRTKWGDPHALRQAVRYLWQVAEGESSAARANHFITICDEQNPDSDSFITDLTGFAQHTICAICSALDTIHQPRESEEVVTAATDVIDSFLMLRNGESIPDNGLAARLQGDPLSIAEAHRQARDMALVAQPDGIHKLRLLSRGERIVNPFDLMAAINKGTAQRSSATATN